MTASPAAIARGCHNKKIYLAQIAADTAIPKAERKTGKPMRSYQCANCHFWHLTTKMQS